MADSFLTLAKRLLPDEAGPYELASLAALLKVMPIDTSPAETVWDPARIPAHLLPALGNELSVDLWDDLWPEIKKRQVVESSPLLHDLKTSIAGYRKYLEIVDCSLVDYVAPPKGFIAAPPFTKEQRSEWLRELPELRLYTGSDILVTDDFCLYAGLGFVDVHFMPPDRGREMRARKARIYDPVAGTLVDVGPVDFDTVSSGQTTVSYESIRVPGKFDPDALYEGLSFFDVGFAVPFDQGSAPVFTWRTDTVGRQGQFSILDAVPYGYGLVDVEPTRVAIRRLAEFGLFADVSSADVAFVGEDDASLGFYDTYRLAKVGQKYGTPLLDAGSYADLDYVGWPTHTLHLLIDATSQYDFAGTFADISYVEQSYATPTDNTRFDAALRAAYVASGPGSDHVTISTEITRPLTLSDGIPLDGSFFFGKRVLRETA
jgi:hypothetical protein